MAGKKKTPKDPDKLVQRLTGTLRYKYSAAYFEYESAVHQLNTLNTKLAALSNQPQFQEIFKLINSQKGLSDKATSLLSKAQKVGEEIREKFSIPEEQWEHYVVDTETGRLTYTPPEE